MKLFSYTLRIPIYRELECLRRLGGRIYSSSFQTARRLVLFIRLCLALFFCFSYTGAWAEVTRATWYDYKKTRYMSNGERFDPTNPYNVAAVNFPRGSILLVSYNGKTLCVRVTDGMPPNNLGRTLDLTPAGADYLGFRRAGVVVVTVTESPSCGSPLRLSNKRPSPGPLFYYTFTLNNLAAS